MMHDAVGRSFEESKNFFARCIFDLSGSHHGTLGHQVGFFVEAMKDKSVCVKLSDAFKPSLMVRVVHKDHGGSSSLFTQFDG